MSEAKFTKGPWAVDDYDERFESIGILSEQNEICEINYLSGKDKHNANLIAAAPEMYEMLEALLEEKSIPTWKGVAMRMLLAKARGEANA